MIKKLTITIIILCLLILSIPIVLSVFVSGVKNPTELLSGNIIEKIWIEKNDSMRHQIIFLPTHPNIDAKNYELYQCLGYQYIKKHSEVNKVTFLKKRLTKYDLYQNYFENINLIMELNKENYSINSIGIIDDNEHLRFNFKVESYCNSKGIMEALSGNKKRFKYYGTVFNLSSPETIDSIPQSDYFFTVHHSGDNPPLHRWAIFAKCFSEGLFLPNVNIHFKYEKEGKIKEIVFFVNTDNKYPITGLSFTGSNWKGITFYTKDHQFCNYSQKY